MKKDKKHEARAARNSLLKALKKILNRKSGKARNEFRYNTQSKHTNYIFEEDNGQVKAVGITHQPTTFDRKNMPLAKNPQKEKQEAAYIRNGIISEKKKIYGKERKNFEFAPEDMPNVKSKIRNYKNRRRKSKKKKK